MTMTEPDVVSMLTLIANGDPDPSARVAAERLLAAKRAVDGGTADEETALLWILNRDLLIGVTDEMDAQILYGEGRPR